MNGPLGVGVVARNVDLLDPEPANLQVRAIVGDGEEVVGPGDDSDGVVVELVHLAHEAVRGRQNVPVADDPAAAEVLLVYLQRDRVLDLVAADEAAPDERGRLQTAEQAAIPENYVVVGSFTPETNRKA